MISIPGYDVIRELGEGGMSVVFLCQHKMLGQLVAVKILHEHLARRKDIRDRFIGEARLMSLLEHPNIVRVIDFLEFEGRIGFVMEYIEGRSLDNVIGREVGPIPHEKAIPLFRQVLEGMRYAHQHGVVHRDLKPSNVMVKPDGTVKITDFGIAKMLGEDSHTQTGTKLGTLYYMSPEQIRSAKGVDHRTDIYALGMTLYEMLAGRLPFDSDRETSEFEVMSTVTSLHVPSPTEFYPHIPDWLVTVVLKALALVPENRFQSCDEILSALKNRLPQQLEFRSVAVKDVLLKKGLRNKFWFIGVAAALFLISIKVISGGTSEVSAVHVSDQSVSPALADVSRHGDGSSSQNSTDQIEPETLLATTTTPGPCFGMAFVEIPTGRFLMGSPATEEGRQETEGPQHEVFFDYSFQMMDTEVTQGMWDEIMPTSVTSLDLSYGQAPEYPVYGISYYQCLDFIYELNKLDHNHVYRLPSEAEWEYACRAGTATPYYATLDSIAVWGLGRMGSYGIVAWLKPNAWGLYDMSGSACEWCQDDWHDNFAGAPTDGSAWLLAAERFNADPKVTRGGHWNAGPQDLRSARRFSSNADGRYYGNGFRVVRTVRETATDDRFSWSGEENSILDARTGLEWLVGPNVDNSTPTEFVQDLNQAGVEWRLPTIAELQDLYNSELDESIWGPVHTESWFVWSSETNYSDRQGLHFFNGIDIGLCSMVGSDPRVFAVRAR